MRGEDSAIASAQKPQRPGGDEDSHMCIRKKQQGEALHFECFICLLFCPCQGKWSKQSVIREQGSAPCHKDDTV